MIFVWILDTALIYWAVAFEVFIVAKCPFDSCSFIYTNNYFQTVYNDSLFILVPANGSRIGISPEGSSEYSDWIKVVMITSGVSALLSYFVLAICVLLPHYSVAKPVFDYIRYIKNYCSTTSKQDDDYNGSDDSSGGKMFDPFVDHHTTTQGYFSNLVPLGAPTCLKKKQALYFSLFLLFTLLLFGIVVISFVLFLCGQLGSKIRAYEIFDVFGVSAHLFSQLCSISSCFIFSKVSYAVSNECKQLISKFTEIANRDLKKLDNEPLSNLWVSVSQYDTHSSILSRQTAQQPSATRSNPSTSRQIVISAEVHPSTSGTSSPEIESSSSISRSEPEIASAASINKGSEDIDIQKLYLYLLQSEDQKYTEILKTTIYPFQVWFTVHWIMYTLTAFMSMAYLIEAFVQLLYDTHTPSCLTHSSTSVQAINNEQSHCNSLYYYFLYLFSFTLLHIVLFLYPCFRAAKITTSRERLIARVSAEKWHNIPASIKSRFVSDLRLKKANFKISLLCSKISFGVHV